MKYALVAGALIGALLNGQEQGRDLKLSADPATLQQRGRLWAVVIGVSRYANIPPESQLRFADRDAQSFAAFLRSPSGGGFASDHIQLLLDEKATLSAVRTSLGTWLGRSAEPEDIVYIFFAGHGVTEGEHDGYLLAHDSDPQNLYATALPITELDKIITQRIRARNIVLIADACHAGNLGWASRGAAEEILISRYLTEVGAAGQGLLRLLASRADERSYEDTQWGGGHGAFTYFLLEGLKGKADRDHDGTVRAAELIGYLSSVVPEQTKALQHPQAAGHMDPAMPLAVVAPAAPRPEPTRASAVSLEVHGAPGTEIYVDNRYFGRIRPAGTLIVDQLQAGPHDLSFDPPGEASKTQKIALTANRTLVDLSVAPPPRPPERSSSLVAAIRQAILTDNIVGAGGAWDSYQRLVRENPGEPQRVSIEAALSTALEEMGQRVINEYVHSPITQMRRDAFHRAAVAFSYLETLRPGDAQLQAKRLFSSGRALVVDAKYDQAAAQLEQAAAADPRAAYIQNALGVAYERLNRNQDATRAFQSAVRLAPAWALPHLHLGLQYQTQKGSAAEREFKTAVELDPRQPLLRETLAGFYRASSRYPDALRELDKLREAAPAYPGTYRELGHVYGSTGEYARATEAFETYLRLAPGSPDNAAVRGLLEKNRAMATRKPPTLKR